MKPGLEKSKIEEAIKTTADSDGRWNLDRAAHKLGAARRTLQNRMREYGMPEGQSGRRKRRLPYGRVGGIATAVTGIAIAAGAYYLGKRQGPSK